VCSSELDAFINLAMKEANKIASSYKPSKEDVVGFKNAFEKEYKSQISYAIRDIVKRRVEADVKDELDKIRMWNLLKR
jgi:hypothetical protein